VIGLIGGIGSGKSQVAAFLAVRGAVVIDADVVGHEVLERPDVRRAVVSRFGPGVLRRAPAGGDEVPSIDRRALGKIVFADSSALRDLESIVHPLMEERFHGLISEAALDGRAPAVVLDAAILLEKGWDRFCDLVVFVDCPWGVRLERVVASRGWSAETLRSRESSQWPVETKRAHADAVIPNDRGLDSLERSVDAFLETLRRPDPDLPRLRDGSRSRARPSASGGPTYSGLRAIAATGGGLRPSASFAAGRGLLGPHGCHGGL